jgi:hypothetical protein
LKGVAIACALVTLPSIAVADVTVTFWTAPAGATLVADGRTWGTTPFALKYKIPRRWNACITVRAQARWISGAESLDVPISICPNQSKNQQVKLERPTAPGLDVDAQYGAQMEQLALMQQQLALQRSIAQDQAWANAWAAVNASLTQIRSRPRIACWSTPDALGLSVWTTCW